MLHAALQVPAVHLVILRPELEGLVVPSKFAGVAAAGRPVIYIGSGEGDIGGMVRESGCGHVVSTGNSSELAARIEGLAGDSEAVARMGERARVCVRENQGATDRNIALLRAMLGAR